MATEKQFATNYYDAREVGMRLKAARKQKGMTRRDLAEKCGISEGTVKRIEQGDNIPSVDKVALICNALHVSADQILETGMQRMQNIKEEIQQFPVFEVLVREDIMNLLDAVDDLKLKDKKFVLEMAVEAAKKLKSYQ